MKRIEIDHDGRRYAGAYAVENGLVTVSAGRETVSRPAGRDGADRTARRLLHALILAFYRRDQDRARTPR